MQGALLVYDNNEQDSRDNQQVGGPKRIQAL